MPLSTVNVIERMRLCTVCRILKSRSQMVRILHQRAASALPGKVVLFYPGQSDAAVFGRSLYFCATKSCVRAALKSKRLHKALKTGIPGDILESLDLFLTQLAD